MKQYIKKSALVAAIKERLKYNGTRAELDRSSYMAGKEIEDEHILALIDTLEVKEIEESSKDLEKERDAFIEKVCDYFSPHISDNSGGYDMVRIIEGFKKYMEGKV